GDGDQLGLTEHQLLLALSVVAGLHRLVTVTPIQSASHHIGNRKAELRLDQEPILHQLVLDQRPTQVAAFVSGGHHEHDTDSSQGVDISVMSSPIDRLLWRLKAQNGDISWADVEQRLDHPYEVLQMM